LGGVDPIYVVRYCRVSEKTHPWPETRVLVYIVNIYQEMRPAAVAKKENENEKKLYLSSLHYLPRQPTLHYHQQSFHGVAS